MAKTQPESRRRFVALLTGGHDDCRCCSLSLACSGLYWLYSLDAENLGRGGISQQCSGAIVGQQGVYALDGPVSI